VFEFGFDHEAALDMDFDQVMFWQGLAGDWNKYKEERRQRQRPPPRG
jgi:hypothetical protein